MENKEHNLQDKRCECCGYMTYHREHMGCIRAAEQAQKAVVVPDGYALVPIEPTEEMIRAGCVAQSNGSYLNYDEWFNGHTSGISDRIRNFLVKDYRAMVSALQNVE